MTRFVRLLIHQLVSHLFYFVYLLKKVLVRRENELKAITHLSFSLLSGHNELSLS